MNASTLTHLPPDELERLFARPLETLMPSGVFRGRWLRRMENPVAKRPVWRWSLKVAFEWTPFGIDFNRRLWFFFGPRLVMGRFDPRAGPSRWRDTDVIGLHYERSRLPKPVRRILYDEIKPLSEDLVLGIGGVGAGSGAGDHFFFALEKMAGPGGKAS